MGKDLICRRKPQGGVDQGRLQPQCTRSTDTPPFYDPADWKLIGNAWDTSAGDKIKKLIPQFLANLAVDPGGQTKLVAQFPEVAARLRKAHDDWFRRGNPAR